MSWTSTGSGAGTVGTRGHRTCPTAKSTDRRGRCRRPRSPSGTPRAKSWPRSRHPAAVRSPSGTPRRSACRSACRAQRYHGRRRGPGADMALPASGSRLRSTHAISVTTSARIDAAVGHGRVDEAHVHLAAQHALDDQRRRERLDRDANAGLRCGTARSRAAGTLTSVGDVAINSRPLFPSRVSSTTRFSVSTHPKTR